MRCKLCLLFCVGLLVPQVSFSYNSWLNFESCHKVRDASNYFCDGAITSIKATFEYGMRYVEKEAIKTELPVKKYNRASYGYRSYPTETNRGFYTGKKCNTNIDHVVSLKDAHLSGASHWSKSKRARFANDRSNHVSTCTRVNSSKGSSTPRDFFRKSSDGKGMEYAIKTKCAYLGIYYQVKQKYDLTFKNNDPRLFSECGLEIE